MPVVQNLQDASRWPLDYLMTKLIIDRADEYSRILTCRITTAFSGICAPSVALNSLSAPISNFQVDRIKHEYLSAIDIFEESRLELSGLPHPPRCIFGDILNFANDETLNQLKSCSDRLSIDVLEEIT